MSEPSPHTDPARWNELIEAIGPDAMLVVIASSMGRKLRAHCTPEDIWQETLAQAWSSRDQYTWRGRTAFRAWIFEIARNRIRDSARKLEAAKRGAGRPAVPFSELEGASNTSAGLLPPDSVTPSRLLMHAEKAAAMQKALAALPPDLEPIVRMHLTENVTMEVIAERLGIGISAAWRRFRKGAAIYARMLSEFTSGVILRRK